MMKSQHLWPDVSPNFKPNDFDAFVAAKLIELEGTPRAVTYFAEVCVRLTDYSYWFLLSTIWVKYTGWSDLQLWKRLFSAKRRMRSSSIMKPSELKIYNQLGNNITCYRAHRPGETDWISYTLDLDTAIKFARQREVNEIAHYRMRFKDVIALFLRRGEQEIIMLQPERAKLIEMIPIVVLPEGPNDCT